MSKLKIKHAVSDAKKISVAVIGATGSVGEALLSVLVERNFPVDKLYALGRGKSTSNTAMFNERPVLVEPLDGFDFSRCQIAFFCAPKAVAKRYALRAVKAGCWVIDTSSQFRLDDAVPLVVPEVNGDRLNGLSGPRIIASPAAPVVQACAALFPLHKKFGLRRVDMTTLLAVSALGRAGIAELAGQTARLLNVQAMDQKLFPAQIAFNLVPAFDAPSDCGYTDDERTSVEEVRKVLGLGTLEVTATQAFVPVFYGHSQIIRAELEAVVDLSEVRKSLVEAGCEFGDTPAEVLTPAGMGTTSDAVFISRCLQGSSRLDLWTLADNIRKGAAINSTAIAETLLKTYL